MCKTGLASKRFWTDLFLGTEPDWFLKPGRFSKPFHNRTGFPNRFRNELVFQNRFVKRTGFKIGLELLLEPDWFLKRVRELVCKNLFGNWFLKTGSGPEPDWYLNCFSFKWKKLIQVKISNWFCKNNLVNKNGFVKHFFFKPVPLNPVWYPFG